MRWERGLGARAPFLSNPAEERVEALDIIPDRLEFCQLAMRVSDIAASDEYAGRPVKSPAIALRWNWSTGGAQL